MGNVFSDNTVGELARQAQRLVNERIEKPSKDEDLIKFLVKALKELDDFDTTPFPDGTSVNATQEDVLYRVNLIVLRTLRWMDESWPNLFAIVTGLQNRLAVVLAKQEQSPLDLVPTQDVADVVYDCVRVCWGEADVFVNIDFERLLVKWEPYLILISLLAWEELNW